MPLYSAVISSNETPQYISIDNFSSSIQEFSSENQELDLAIKFSSNIQQRKSAVYFNR